MINDCAQIASFYEGECFPAEHDRFESPFDDAWATPGCVLFHRPWFWVGFFDSYRPPSYPYILTNSHRLLHAIMINTKNTRRCALHRQAKDSKGMCYFPRFTTQRLARISRGVALYHYSIDSARSKGFKRWRALNNAWESAKAHMGKLTTVWQHSWVTGFW